MRFSVGPANATKTGGSPLKALFSSCTILNLVTVLVIVMFTLRFGAPLVASSSQRSATTSGPSYYKRAQKQAPKCTTGVDHKPARSFLIVFMSRSGSTAIATSLQKHPKIYIPRPEYLDKYPVPTNDLKKIINHTRGYFDEGLSKGQIPGFKIRAHHILQYPEAWSKLVHEYNTRVIWQYRKNILKSAVGTYQREELGDETAIGGIKVQDLSKPRCEMGVGCSFRVEKMDQLYRIMNSRLLFEQQVVKSVGVLDDKRGCTLEVPYEDYLYYPKDTMDDIFRFLGVQPQPVQSARVKATSDNLCTVISNYDEVCSNFYGCAVWQPYFDDFINGCRCDNFTHGKLDFCSVKDSFSDINQVVPRTSS